MRLGLRRRSLFATLVLCAACSQPPVHDDPAHAMAIAYVRRPLQDGFSIAAAFTLPRVPANKGWYAQWFTYTTPPGAGAKAAPYLQVGMVRSSEAAAKLQAFVALRSSRRPPTVRALGVLSEKTHHLAFALQRGVLAFTIDGKPYYHENAADFFAPAAKGTYLQVGHELSHPGDTAAGSLGDIEFASPGGHREAPFAVALNCYFFSNGVSLTPARNGGLTPGGTFDADSADVARCER